MLRNRVITQYIGSFGTPVWRGVTLSADTSEMPQQNALTRRETFIPGEMDDGRVASHRVARPCSVAACSWSLLKRSYLTRGGRMTLPDGTGSIAPRRRETAEEKRCTDRAFNRTQICTCHLCELRLPNPFSCSIQERIVSPKGSKERVVRDTVCSVGYVTPLHLSRV